MMALLPIRPHQVGNETLAAMPAHTGPNWLELFDHQGKSRSRTDWAGLGLAPRLITTLSALASRGELDVDMTPDRLRDAVLATPGCGQAMAEQAVRLRLEGRGPLAASRQLSVKFSLDQAYFEVLDRLASAHRLTRSEVVRRLLVSALERAPEEYRF